MKDIDITAFGEILIDFTYVGDSEGGQKMFAQNAGGAPANVLVSATKLGSKTAFFGKVGEDMHGEFLCKTLSNEDVNIEGLVKDENYFTTLAFVDLNEAGERSFSFARKHGADTFMTKNEINLEILGKSKIFHLGSLSLTTDFIESTTIYAIEKAKEFGAIISYDPNYRESLWKSKEEAKIKMKSIIPYADLMKISDEECELLTGEKEPLLAAKKLNDQGVKVVCVTLGEKGALLSIEGQYKEIEGYKSERVIDTTGAGDSFWGGFLSQIISNKKALDEIEFSKFVEFVRVANATASLCVEKSGAIRAMPTLEEVKKRMRV